MRTRNADNPKSPPPAKRTPPARKSASKTPPTPPDAAAQPPSDSTTTPKRASSTRGKAVATAVTESPDIKVEDETVTVKGTPGTKSGNKRTVKKVVKRTIIRKKAKPKPVSVKVEHEEEDNDSEVGEEKEKLEEVKDEDVGVSVKGQMDVAVKGEGDLKERVEGGSDVGTEVENENVGGDLKQESCDQTVGADSGHGQGVKVGEKENVEGVEEDLSIQEPSLEKVEGGEKENMEAEERSLPIQETSLEEEEVDEKEDKETDEEEPYEDEEPEKVLKEEPDFEEVVENREVSVEMEIEKNVENEELSVEIKKVELENEPVDMEKDIDDEYKEDEDPQERLCFSDEEKDKDIGNDGHDEEDEDEIADDKGAEHGDLGIDMEQAEITAAAEDRRRRKEFEVFVGGLDRDATEEDVKKVFQNAGEVVEVRMHKELPTNKNKGYAFVRFASKEYVARALAEMKNPVIRGKRCGTAPSEDNDTLFLGNICNTWTKEAIRQKLKDYGIEGLERITLVPDPQHEGLSRGFAFIEFSGHPDAMLAFKRLQKPDAIFGHPDRTAKVAFAEPLREPDPDVLAQVKSVFVDGLPPHWDEDIVREHLKSYGSIERVTLARNMSTAKRKDFGFIDFATHEAALACIDGINKRELGDEKMKVRARLSNPLPKTQAVKGGIAGGFRIGQGTGATFPRGGRGFGRGVFPSNRMSFPRGRGLYQHGPGQTSRMGFAEDYLPTGPRPPFRGRQNFGGRWDNYRGSHHPSGQGTVPPRYDVDRLRHGTNMGRDHHMPMTGRPFFPEEQFIRPYSGRHYEDLHTYGDTSRGVKRPYFPDQDPGYSESSRAHPRLDYPDPTNSSSATRSRGGGTGGHSRDYYNYDYSSYHGSERPYVGDRPYGDDRPYGGDRPYGVDRPYGGDRPYAGDRPYGSDRPYGGGRSYGGRYYY